MTAYVSPNDRRAYAVLANTTPNGDSAIGGPPTYLAVIDIAALLSAPRVEGSHTVNQDLICNGILRYVPTTTNPNTPPSSCD